MVFIRHKIFSVVKHPLLASYFSNEITVFNEREIVDTDNQVMIPDRLVFTKEKDVVIIDYKTGVPSPEHHQQLLKYERVLQSMNFTVDKKLLVYMNDEIDIIKV